MAILSKTGNYIFCKWSEILCSSLSPRDKGKQFGFQGLEQGYLTYWIQWQARHNLSTVEMFSFYGKATWKNCLETIPFTLDWGNKLGNSLTTFRGETAFCFVTNSWHGRICNNQRDKTSHRIDFKTLYSFGHRSRHYILLGHKPRLKLLIIRTLNNTSSCLVTETNLEEKLNNVIKWLKMFWVIILPFYSQ